MLLLIFLYIIFVTLFKVFWQHHISILTNRLHTSLYKQEQSNRGAPLKNQITKKKKYNAEQYKKINNKKLVYP